MKLKELLEKWEQRKYTQVYLDILEVHEFTLYEKLTVKEALKLFGESDVNSFSVDYDEDDNDITLSVSVWG